MAIRFFQVDAFADEPFAGNPAAVCLLPSPGEESWMQHVAAEMNLSETAFLVRREDGYDLRWFTPQIEVDLCGHATLASAHVLWETGAVEAGGRLRFHTRSGELSAEQSGDQIVLDFPATPADVAPPARGLVDAIGIMPSFVGRSMYDYLLEVETEEAVRHLKPDFDKLREVGVRGVIVTSRSTSGQYDFVSRFFAPGSGVDEDPVTGSAHCCLAPYWGEKLGKREMTGYQASARGGRVHVRLEGDRVRLGGRAVTVMRGELLY